MANEIMTEKEKQQTKKMENFLKEAFCINGSCNYIEDVKVNSTLKTTTSAMFALEDSKRGVFYVTISK
jgi:hypothetical protein